MFEFLFSQKGSSMTTSMMIVWSVIAVLGLVVLWAIGSYNSFIRLKALLNEAWSGIDVQLKRRYDLIPNLVEVVKGYSIHEKGILEDVTRLRTESIHAKNIQEKSAAEEGISQILKTLFAVAESYPNLKANENFLSLQKDLGFIEQEVQLARRYYNGTACNYNSAVQQFPSSIIARSFGFFSVPYFELSTLAERETPKVRF
jgi:LemA protein